jgi:hypothetical protein
MAGLTHRVNAPQLSDARLVPALHNQVMPALICVVMGKLKRGAFITNHHRWCQDVTVKAHYLKVSSINVNVNVSHFSLPQ